MSSSVFDIMFKNIEHFTVENQTEFNLLPKEKFEQFELLQKNHKIQILNPKTKTCIASFAGENLTYGYDQNEK